MKLVLFLVTLLPLSMLNAQPMSGNYTVGGTSPDFAALQDAADALKRRGVSGPVFFNIRSGIYTRNGGNNTVLRLDTLVTGVSAANRITFQPDAASGGNVDNVILQFNRTDPSTADRDLVHIQLDFVTLRNLTLEDIDSSHTFNGTLVRLQQQPLGRNPTVDGFVLEGCKLIGTSFIAQPGIPLGTDFGIVSNRFVGDVTIRNNTFVRLLRAISIAMESSTPAQATITIEDNQILDGYNSRSGSGNLLGAGIEATCTTAVLRRNVIDFTNGFNGGWQGINVTNPTRATITHNLVRGPSGRAMWIRHFLTTPSESVLIANNMIASGHRDFGQPVGLYGLASEGVRNAMIVHNSIVIPLGQPNSFGVRIALRVFGENCTVLNNIVINNSNAFLIAYDLGGAGATPNLRSDYNVIRKQENTSGPLIIHEGRQYALLPAFQDSTGLDTNSISRTVFFINLTSDLHLANCEGFDPELKGIPVPGIVDDFDGDVRSLIEPVRGADEPVVRTVPMFGDVFRMPIPGFITDIAAGKFDNLSVDGLAVADFTNSQVRLYHNLPSSRSFELSQVLSPGFQPMNVKLFDLDDDGNPDVIVSGNVDLADGQQLGQIRVYWGDGGGGFPSDTTINVGRPVPPVGLIPWGVVSIDTGRVTLFPSDPPLTLETIILSLGPATMPPTNFLGYLDNRNGRTGITFRVIERPAPSVSEPDSIPGILRDFVVADIDGNGDPEVASILAASVVTDFVAFNDTIVAGGGGSFFRFGTHYNYSFGATSYMQTSSVVTGDFDGDGDLDFVTTATSDNQLVFLRNQGSFNFSSEPIPVNNARGLAVLDYDNDGDLDFVTVNRLLQDNGVTVFLNDGLGIFRPEFNCFQGFASGQPLGVVASDFDLDGRTDVAIASASDSVFVLYNFGGGITGIREPGARTPADLRLEQNYPNPFNPTTTIRYEITKPGRVSLKVYNLLGQQIKTLVDAHRPAGSHTVTWDGRDDRGRQVGSGVYFYKLQTTESTSVKKMIFLR